MVASGAAATVAVAAAATIHAVVTTAFAVASPAMVATTGKKERKGAVFSKVRGV
ncbi:MAG: hypothetical protein OXN83_02100 [Oligoflexia bacterium]|nr:hypothetical protein [Oligoflexia bacterium]